MKLSTIATSAVLILSVASSSVAAPKPNTATPREVLLNILTKTEPSQTTVASTPTKALKPSLTFQQKVRAVLKKPVVVKAKSRIVKAAKAVKKTIHNATKP